MALGGEVVHLVGAHFGDYLHYRHRVAEVGVVEVEVGMAFEVGDAFAEVYRRAAYHAVDVVAFVEEEFGEVASVLTGDTGDECCLHIFSVVMS